MNNKSARVHEPLIHITKREVGTGRSVGIHALGILAALLVCGLFIILFTGLSPVAVYKAMYDGTYGGEITRIPSLHRAAILLCLSLAVTPAFKMKFWNLGAEGQALIGAVISAYCMMNFGGSLDQTTLLILMFVASVIGGAIWALIPAICKALWNTNETLFTLMMNYVAMTLVSYFIMSNDRSGRSDLGIINERTGFGYLPELLGKPYVFNIVISTVVLVVIFVYMRYSKQGYEISVVGESENTARYIGINVKKVIIRTVAISGALCGLVGFMIVSGDKHSLYTDIMGGQGFTAVMVSWMSKFNPVMMVLVSLLIVFLGDGGKSATSAFNADNSIGDILTAIVIFFIIGCEFFTRYKVNFRHSKKEGNK